MNEFTFSTVADVLVGPGTSAQLGAMARGMGITRALLVTDPGIVQFGLLENAEQNLHSNHIAYSLYADVVADPPEAVVRPGGLGSCSTGRPQCPPATLLPSVTFRSHYSNDLPPG